MQNKTLIGNKSFNLGTRACFVFAAILLNHAIFGGQSAATQGNALQGVEALVPKFRQWTEPAWGLYAEKNPPLLMWPKGEEKKRKYAVQLSMDKNFPPTGTVERTDLGWSIFLPSEALAEGTWYWRVRYGDDAWTAVNTFQIGEPSQRWDPPTAESLNRAIPTYRPRLLVDAPDWEAFRDRVKNRQEVEHILRDAETAMTASMPEEEQSILLIEGKNAAETRKLQLDQSEVIGQAVYAAVGPLCKAYVVTGDKRYAEKAVAWALEASQWDPKGVTHLSNFADSRIMLSLAMVVDTCGPFLSETQKQQLVEASGTRANNFFKLYVKTAQDLKAVSGHFWQHILHYMFDTAIALHGEDARAEQWLAFCYETFLARAPLLGGGDGGWAEGISYFRMNMEMLIDIPWRIRHYTGFDFIKETPWYTLNTDLLLYAFPPGSASAGFADNTHDLLEPRGDYLAYADVLSRVVQNPYATWYAQKVEEVAKDLNPFYQAYWRYHFINSDTPRKALGDARLFQWNRLRYLYTIPAAEARSPENLPMSRVFEGEGLITMHSQPIGSNPDRNLFVAMRSSPLGASGHMLADQNSFNLVYGGERLFYHTGYKVAMSAPHRRKYYMTTKSHNGILVDGEGQPFEMDAYAWVENHLEGDVLAYAVGNASNAYSSVTTGMDSGLKTFKRHLLLLRPDLLIIYDELEAEADVEWSYLLHSYSPITLEGQNELLKTRNGKGTASVKLYSSSAMEWQVSHAYPVPARNWRGIKDENGNLIEYPDNAWHFTATTEKAKSTRFVGLYQLVNNADEQNSPSLECTEVSTGHYAFGNWEIHVELDASKPAGLIVMNTEGTTIFSSPNASSKSLPELGNAANARLFVRKGTEWTVEESVSGLPPQATYAQQFYLQENQ